MQTMTTTATTDPVLTTLFAIQVNRSDEPQDLALLICQAGVKTKKLFRRIHLLNNMEVGTTWFTRCKTDLEPELVEEVLKTTGRAYAVQIPGTANFEVKFPNGKVGKMPPLYMFSTVQVRGHLFKGPKVVKWELQFPALNSLGHE